jgi:hypothetical protein
MHKPLLPRLTSSSKKKKEGANEALLLSTTPMLDKLGSYGREGTNCNIRGSDVSELLRGAYTAGLVDLLPDSDSPAIVQPYLKSNNQNQGTKLPLTHKRLKQFVANEFDLCQFGLEKGCRWVLSISCVFITLYKSSHI